MKYYIISGEASGDLHGSNLMRALIEKDPDAEIRFWGGDLMQEVGGVMVKHFKSLAFMGFWEVLIHLRTILKNITFCKKDILHFDPDAIIYIDYPGFNLRIAKWAKGKGFRNHYYISPQVWAWKESRVHQMKKVLDALYVILPFEKEFFEVKHQFNVHFVGHPLLEFLNNREKALGFKKENQLSDRKAIIALLPGSRKQEIKKMLPIFLRVIPHFPDYQFVLAAAPGIALQWYQSFIKNNDLKIIANQTHDLLAHAKGALVSSGTATLETALLNVPQVVCYRTSFLSFEIGKRLVKVKFISLVNLIMDRGVVTELVQNDFNEKNIVHNLKYILSSAGQKKLKNEYKALGSILGAATASKKTAQLIIDKIR